jgi:hypothetical protein
MEEASILSTDSGHATDVNPRPETPAIPQVLPPAIGRSEDEKRMLERDILELEHIKQATEDNLRFWIRRRDKYLIFGIPILLVISVIALYQRHLLLTPLASVIGILYNYPILPQFQALYILGVELILLLLPVMFISAFAIPIYYFLLGHEISVLRKDLYDIEQQLYLKKNTTPEGRVFFFVESW